MIIRCSLSQNKGFIWKKLKCVGGELSYKGNDWGLRRQLKLWAADKEADIHSLKKLLAELPYHYAVVFQGENDFFAAVDQVRTHPLFYYIQKDTLHFVDDPYGIEGVNLKKNDALALAEFQLSGYAGRGDTLDCHLKSLQARHYLWASFVNGSHDFSVIEYLPRIHGKVFQGVNSSTVHQNLLEGGDEIFSELCEGVRDRQIVLPLSSGYDSQYIAAMLKRHGHKDVVAYTYGKHGNWELNKSRETAKKLGFRWHFIPYDRALWRARYESQEMKAYLLFSARHTSTPHIQDWPAVRELKKKKIIAADSIFIPGHTCMLTSSNRLEPSIFQQASPKSTELLSHSLYRHHFILQKTKRVIDRAEPVLRRIQEALPTELGNDPHEILNAYFNYEAEERHGKLIINSARVYEYWGHQWVMPLWDKRMISVWVRVPYEGRYSKREFNQFLYKENFYGLFPQPPTPNLYSRFREKIKQIPLLFKPLKRIKCAENRLFGYFHNYFDWYGIISYPSYVYNMGRCGDVYSLLSREYLEYLDARLESTERQLN